MQIPHEAVLLRIFIGESDRWEHKPLYEAIVLKAREAHLAGATVLRGPMGYGKSSRLHTAKILRLSMDLPLVIEIVDSEEKINTFLPVLDPMIGVPQGTTTVPGGAHLLSAKARCCGSHTPLPVNSPCFRLLCSTPRRLHPEKSGPT